MINLRLYHVAWRTCLLVIGIAGSLVALPLLLDHPRQQRIEIGVAEQFTESRAWGIEQTPQQLAFRWVPNTVSIPIPIWSPFMVLRTHTWLQPDTTHADVRIGGVAVTLSGSRYQSPRVIRVLLGAQPPTRDAYTVSSTAGTPRWAFTTMELTATQRFQMLPRLWGAWCVLCVVLASIVARWWPARWWQGVIGASVVTTLGLAHTTTLGFVIYDIAQEAASPWLRAGVVVVFGVLMVAPRYVRWLRQQHRVPRFVIGAYTVITLVPLCATLFHESWQPMPIEENRRLAAFPALQEPVAYTKALESWLMDHIGLRAVMIRSKNEIDYRLLRSSSRVYFGQDDTIFLRRWSDERFPALTQILTTPAARATLHQRIREQATWYEQRGMTCYVVIAPSKEIIYPELLPWYVPRYDYRQEQDFESELRAAGVRVVPAYAILKAIKPTVAQLYYPQDFHWNRIATYHIGEYIMADLARLRATPPSAPVPLTINQQAVPFYDRRFAALLSDGLPFPSSYEGSVATEYTQYTMHTPSPIEVLEYDTSAPVVYAQQSMLIIGDSFSARLHDTGFPHGFTTIYRMAQPSDRIAHAQWLATTTITTVVIQLRDVSLPLYLYTQKEQ